METSETPFAHQSSVSAYLLDNAGKEAPARFDALSAAYDHHTIRHLLNRGVTEGWHCLEVGGGGGSISLWLADRVGPNGHVVATDIDPRFLEPLKAKNLEVQRHNIATDSLPQSAFDLIHARLVLIHVPEREQVLARLVAALKPGGWLIEEEIDSASLLPDPSLNPDEVLLKTQIAAMRLVDDCGVGRRWGRLLFGRLRALGMMNVDAEAIMSMWHSGSIGASIIRANFEQLRRRLIEGSYITEQEFEHDIARLNEPDFMAPSPIMWTAWGQRPAA
jgi:2-polyprenyl-3-methyl-5-hydroxy-6-metoxy-1,4-benzoquinol methylase